MLNIIDDYIIYISNYKYAFDCHMGKVDMDRGF